MSDSQNRELYLDLLMKSLVNWIYLEHESSLGRPARINYSKALKRLLRHPEQIPFKRVLNKLKRKVSLGASQANYNVEQNRSEGRDWSPIAHTMVGLQRLENIKACASTVITESIPGDFIETGVWRGGACIFMRGILKAFGDKDRTVWCADSFQGLPSPNPAKYPEDMHDIYELFSQLSVSQDTVKNNFARYNLLDDQVKFLQGWFSETLPNAPISQIALLRLDGDMYESTMDGLENLYHKVSPGGYIIVDDYQLGPCRKAIEDFRKTVNSNETIEQIDYASAFWRKEK